MRKRTIHLLALAAVLACACGASREQILTKTFAGVQAAELMLDRYDERKQAELVAASTSLEEGRKALAEHRARRDKILIGVVAAYGAIATASIDLNEANLLAAVQTAASVVRAIRELTP